MRPLVACLFLLLPTGFVCAQDDEPAEWKEFNPRGGGFSIKMPGKPMPVAMPDLNILGKKVKNPYWAYKHEEHFELYAIGYHDIPFGLADSDTTAFLKAVQEHELEGAEDGELVSSKAIKIAGHPGREFTIKFKPFWMRLRTYLVDSRCYKVAVLGGSTFVRGKDATRYLDSFELID